MAGYKIAKLTIFTILTHGKAGAVHGDMLMTDGKIYAFSDVYDFSSAKGNKVQKLYSYITPVQGSE